MCCSNFLLRLLNDFHALALQATRHTEKILKAADTISCHQGHCALLVLNMPRSSLHFKAIVLRAVMSAAFVLVILAHPAQARSYPINGSFETGEFTG